jgi:hypothetical protein
VSSRLGSFVQSPVVKDQLYLIKGFLQLWVRQWWDTTEPCARTTACSVRSINRMAIRQLLTDVLLVLDMGPFDVT